MITKRRSKTISKSNLYRHLFLLDGGSILSVRLATKRVRKKFIKRYITRSLKEDT